MKAKIKLQGKEVVIEDIEEMRGINKFIGLMFKPLEYNALLFKFSKGRRAIHSLFCKKFLAIWFLDRKIVEYKLIEPWKFSVKPEKEFDTLIEIPVNLRYSNIFEHLPSNLL